MKSFMLLFVVMVIGTSHPIAITTFGSTPPRNEVTREAPNVASEWYDTTSWHSTRVNPYLGRKVALPTRHLIECTPFHHPTDGLGRVSSGYGWRPRFGRMHRGIDIAVPLNSPIYSVWSGVVRVAGYEPKGYGQYIVVRHHNGLETIYGHLNRQLLKRGDKVQAGTLLGYSGNTGRSSGPHLHFETRFLGGDFNPTHIINFRNHQLHRSTFLWTKNLYPAKRHSARLITYRLKEATTLEQLCEDNDWDLEELCLYNGLLPDMPLAKGRLIRILKEGKS